jgi:hypothetical protein
MKKHHFDVFQHKKHFEKQPQPHYQTGVKSISYLKFQIIMFNYYYFY